jgi:hypothetical protein
MSEQPPRPETVDTYLLDGHPLSYWHEQIIADDASGEPAGYLRVPCI